MKSLRQDVERIKKDVLETYSNMDHCRDSILAITAKPWKASLDSIVRFWDTFKEIFPDSVQGKALLLLQKPVFLDLVHITWVNQTMTNKIGSGLGIILIPWRDSTRYAQTIIPKDGSYKVIHVFNSYDCSMFGPTNMWYGRGALISHELLHVLGYDHIPSHEFLYEKVDDIFRVFAKNRLRIYVTASGENYYGAFNVQVKNNQFEIDTTWGDDPLNDIEQRLISVGLGEKFLDTYGEYFTVDILFDYIKPVIAKKTNDTRYASGGTATYDYEYKNGKRNLKIQKKFRVPRAVQVYDYYLVK